MRFRNITKITGLASCAAALPLTAVAQWQLIDDFEDYTELRYETGGDPDLVYPGASNGGRGFMDIWGTADGIEGVGGEQAAHFWHGITDNNAGDFWHQLALPQEIPLNETGTLYLRIWQDGYDLNWHTMLSKIAAGEEPQATALWGNQAAIFRFDGNDPLVIQAHNAGYGSSDLQPALETWYQYWMVAHNNGANGYYEIYVQGPDDSSPQLMAFDDATQLEFRNKGETSIKTLVLIRNGQFGTEDIFLVDDIYFSEGENLTNPIDGGSGGFAEEWADWGDDDVDNYVDTGAGFLGWIYFDGSGWIYVQDMAQWIYLPEENVSASGAWSYLPR